MDAQATGKPARDAFNAAVMRGNVSGFTQTEVALGGRPQNQGSSAFCDWSRGSQNMSHTKIARRVAPANAPALSVKLM
jgi:hypothetical protein